MMTLADLNEMEVNVEVNENDIVRVHLGDTADIEVDAYLDKKFTGVVTEVANSANVTGVSTDQVTNFTVKVRILRESYITLVDSMHPDRGVFQPGMSATVDIRTRKAEGVVTVPIQSVTTRDTVVAGSMSAKEAEGPGNDDDELVAESDAVAAEPEKKEVECVFVLENEVVRLRPVTTGLQDNTHIEIKTGLKAGERIVTAPYSAISRMLKDNDAVEVVKKDQLYSGNGK